MRTNLNCPRTQCPAIGCTTSTTTLASSAFQPITIALAADSDRDAIHRSRYEVYAREIRQHAPNDSGRLRDALDGQNVYLIARVRGELAGFISITPPRCHAYSIDKYFDRKSLPFPTDQSLYEVRLLTVLKPHRGRQLAFLLMYAAFRWVEAHGGDRIMAIGRREILDLYLRAGLEPAGLSAVSGEVTYDLLHATIARLRGRLPEFAGVLLRMEDRVDWQLSFPLRQPACCFHGGAFFTAIGDKFDALDRRHSIINADVLDAWFPPSPRVLSALRGHLEWLLQTSPPTGCEGLIETIAIVRGVLPKNILPGAGSSDLMFRALCHWLKPGSHVLILDPTYGEYAHILEKVIGCTVDRLSLSNADDYAVDLARLEAALADGYDLVVLVNPNSPTGRHIPRAKLEPLLQRAPHQTRIWVDETYVDYAGSDQSLESYAAGSEHVVVCKSMSKVYALSGARVAYLCAGPHQLEALRAITPPWVVSLPAQVAAICALQDPGYYTPRYRQTAQLRETLADGLRQAAWKVVPGVANFLLCQLPESGPDCKTVVARLRTQGLFLRDVSSMGTQLGPRAVRIAVKDAVTNERMVEIIGSCDF